MRNVARACTRFAKHVAITSILARIADRFGQHHLTQVDQMTCGPTCLRMVASKYGRTIDGATALRLVPTSRIGVSIADMMDGGRRMGVEITPQWVHPDHLSELEFPVILLWRQSHYIVLWEVRGDRYLISDPASTGSICIHRADIDAFWVASEEGMGIVLGCTRTTPTANIDWRSQRRESGVRTLFRLLSGQGRDLGRLAALYLAIVCITIAVPMLLTSLYRNAMAPEAIDAGEALPLGIAMLILARAGFEYLRTQVLSRIAASSSERILGEFLDRIFAFSFLHFSRRRHGDYLLKLHAHEKIRTQIKSPSFYVVFDLATLVVVAVLLFALTPAIGLVYVVAVVLIVGLAIAGLPRARLLRFQGYNLKSVTRTLESDILQGMLDIKAAGREDAFRAVWRDQVRSEHAIEDALVAHRETQRSIASAVLGLCALFAVVVAVAAVQAGESDVSEMLLIVIVLGMVTVPTQQFAEFVRSIDDLLFYVKQLADIQNMIGPVPDIRMGKQTRLATEVAAGNRGLNLRGVRFAFPAGQRGEILRGVDITVPPGGSLAVMGPSGTGKSCLAKIVAGLYEPTAGHMDWRGGDIMRQQPRIGSVMQDGRLFGLPAKQNIAFGLPDYEIDYQRLDEVIRICALSAVVKRLPMGLDTILGSSGIAVSGGEKQRFLIARALYQLPDLLVLDEATSGLDMQTQAQVLTAIRAEYPAMTLVVVTHSAAVARLMDEVAMIEDGLVVSRGSHAALEASCVRYRELLRRAEAANEAANAGAKH
jgi:ATP-binding cassette subfamily B protein